MLGDGPLGGGRRDEGNFFDDVEAGAAEELVDDGLGEAAGVVFEADGLFRFAELEAADAVDLTEAREGHDGGFGGGRAVAVEDVQLGHRGDDSSGNGKGRQARQKSRTEKDKTR